jgi:polar amino acid transport system permease protein
MPYQSDFGAVLQYWDLLLNGVWLTVRLSAIATALGLIVGIAGALGRRSRVAPLRWLAGAYVEIVRNTPFLVQLFFIFFGLPSAGVRIDAEEAALLAMVFNLGAYATEIVRAGMDATTRGQIEAGLSLGLSRWLVFRHVILVPALAKVYPALTSQFIIVMLGSSVVSQISAEELTFAAGFIQSRNFRNFEVYFIVTLLYLALAIGFRQVFHLIGARAFRFQNPP